MPRQRAGMVGRHDELAALRPDGRRPVLSLVRGATGSGRSALMGRLAQDLRTDGLTVLELGFADATPSWDLYGARALLDAVRDGFERLDADPALATSIGAVSRLCTPRTYATPGGRAALLAELGRMFTRIGGTRRVALLADDADAVAAPVFALAPAHRAGHVVVAGVTADPAGRVSELVALADRVVDLGPLPDADVVRLLRQAVNARVDPAVLAALRAALGPLYGNPATLLATVADLRRRDRLVVVHGHLCLRDSAEPIALPADHDLLAVVGEPGGPGRELVVLVAGPAAVGVDDVPALAVATGRTPAECGPEVDRLVLAGVLAVDATGRLDVPCAALASAVVEQEGVGRLRELHRAMAVHLLAAGRSAHDPSVTADHVAAAGPAFPPSAELATTLHDEAVRVAVLHPDRALRRYRAAWRHAGPGVGRERVQAELIRLLVRTGHHVDLADFVAEIVAEGATDPGSRANARVDLATAAALAALHCGRPVSGEVRAALAGPAGDPAPLRFCDRWFAGDDVSLDEFVRCFTGFTDGWPQPHGAPVLRERARRVRPSFGIDLAFRTRHLVPVFGWLLGADYRPPTGGSLAAFHRVVQGHADGAWSDALCAARELTVAPQADALSTQIATLLAAEMSTWRGEDRAAAAWVGSLPADCPYDSALGWVACGTAHRAGDAAGALSAGWRSYPRLGSGLADLGGWRLLVRMAVVAVESGQLHWSRRLHAESVSRSRRSHNSVAGESAALVEGLVTGDEQRVLAAVEQVRRREHRPDLAWACLAAGLVAADPQPLLHEAHEIAQDIGAARIRAVAKQVMEARGVPAPVVKARSTGLSPVELRIVDLIREGCTNRQIALKTRVSEKTVENHLTKLFLKVGCRTRHGLAAASLDGRLESVGA